MKKYLKISLTFLLFFCISLSNGQGETWRWHFGTNAALNFPNGGAPVAVLTSVMTTFEGCASIGTPAGAVAFYTNGTQVWGANNIQMPNGFGLLGNGSTTQAAIIVPRPGNPNLYYIFCSSSNFSPGTLSYSEVNLTLNAGFGNVTAVKNVIIQTNIAEKLTAVRHCNGVDVWVICHDYTNNNYKAFLVTATGVNTTPVVSAAGANTAGNVVGVIKTSPNGKKIAYCASNGPFALHVADFDNTTGVVSNAINLAGNAALVPMYGLEFSPDSKILYGSRWSGSNQVWQWDICGNSAAAVVASALMVGTGANTHGQMQLGPDGKIYIARAGSTFLGVINNPNTLGVGCSYVANGVSLGNKTSQYGLPTFIQSYLTTPPPPFTSTMSCMTGSFAAPSASSMTQGCSSSTFNPVSGYLWNFGDPASAASNTSTLANPTHVFSAPGTYTVKLILNYACSADTITGVVTAISCGPSVLINGTNLCPGVCSVITATPSGGTGPYSYTWTPNLGVGPGPFTVCPTSTTIYSVIVSDITNTTGVDTAIVIVNPLPTITVNSPTACLNTSFTLTATGGTAYAWSGPNSFTSNVQDPAFSNVAANLTGNYSVIATSALGCTNTAVAFASVVPLPNISVSGPNVLCSQNFNGSTNTVTLIGNGASTYSWTLPNGFTAIPNLNSSPIIVTPSITTVEVVATLTVEGTLGTCSNSAVYNLTVVPNPVISVGTASMCFGTSAVLTASGATSFVWSPGATLNSTIGSSVIASPANTSTYSVYGTSLNCNSPSQTTTVDVIPTPTITINTAGVATICAGTSIVLNASGATSYTWMPANFLDNTTNPSVIATPPVSTLFTVIGTLNTCTASATKQVTVITLPTLQAISQNTAICSGGKTTINANGADNYTWTPSFGINDVTSNFVVASPPVTTMYTLIGNNGLCTASLNVLISVVPSPVINLTASNQKICEGTTSTIFATGATNYVWTPNKDINFVTPNTGIVSPSVTTNYTVMGYNFAGTLQCSMTQEIIVEVIPTVKAAISNSVFICEGKSTQLKSSGSDTYNWTPTDGLNNPRIANPIANPKTTTEYTVNVSTGGYCGDKATVLVIVGPSPVVDAGPDQVVNMDEPLFLDAKGTGTLKWIAGPGIICLDCPNSQVKTENSGIYIIEAINANGCKAQDEVKIEITKDYNIYIPNVFTPNFDGNNDEFLVYGTGITKIEMIIFDRWGEKLFTSTEQLKGWDGTHKGVMSKNDTYPYLINFTTLDGKKHKRTGHVTLLK